jgi:hypothetical protein
MTLIKAPLRETIDRIRVKAYLFSNQVGIIKARAITLQKLFIIMYPFLLVPKMGILSDIRPYIILKHQGSAIKELIIYISAGSIFI